MAEMYALPCTTSKGVVTTVGAVLGGKVALVVNTASACGFTPQLEGLEALQKAFGPERFTVVAYPCNQFGGQNPESTAETETFCTTRFKTTFPIMDKCEVNGANADPLWTYLKTKKSGLLGFSGMCVGCARSPCALYCPYPFHRPSPPLPPRALPSCALYCPYPLHRPCPCLPPRSKWNFSKFLIDQKGEVIERYAPTTTPAAIEKDIRALLG